MDGGSDVGQLHRQAIFDLRTCTIEQIQGT